MKIRKSYFLYVNRMTSSAFYGGDDFYLRIKRATFGELFECTLPELKNNLRILQKQKFQTIKRKK